MSFLTLDTSCPSCTLRDFVMIRTGPCGGPPNLPARRVLEPLDFLRRQFPPLSGFQAGIPEGADRDAPQPNDLMADRLAHPPDFTIAAFVNRDDPN